jgi:hypothetical protein
VIDAWDRLRLKIDGRDEQIVGTPHPGEAVRAEDEHLLYCIERDEEPRVSGALGLQAVELALATLASSDQSAVIGLPMPR